MDDLSTNRLIYIASMLSRLFVFLVLIFSRVLNFVLFLLIVQQWHPDKWTKSTELCGVAKRKFQQIQEAYSVLSDSKKCKLYDLGLYDPDEEEDEGLPILYRKWHLLLRRLEERRDNTAWRNFRACSGTWPKVLRFKNCLLLSKRHVGSVIHSSRR